MDKVRRCEVTQQILNSSEFEECVADVASGAVITFAGNVRNHDNGREVLSLRYEVHPSADRILNELVARLAQDHDVDAIAVAHRYGQIPLGETAFVVAVSAAHRDSAFHACSQIVDEVKANLPIWKYQEFSDGNHEWVNFA